MLLPYQYDLFITIETESLIEKRTRFRIKFDAFHRFLLWHLFSHHLGLILVSEFPKSGGTWLCQMLSNMTRLPFPRNVRAPMTSCILHSHFLYSKGLRKPIYLIRDGRDVMVSAYYHFLYPTDKKPAFLVRHWRKNLNFKDYSDIKKNMPQFIDYMFHNYTVNGRRINWQSHFRSFENKEDVLLIRYEDLLNSPEAQLLRTMNHLGYTQLDRGLLERTVNLYSFENQSRRTQGDEDNYSFMRKGIKGDWKNKFSISACEMFDDLAGDTLIRLGYETDHNWY